MSSTLVVQTETPRPRELQALTGGVTGCQRWEEAVWGWIYQLCTLWEQTSYYRASLTCVGSTRPPGSGRLVRSMGHCPEAPLRPLGPAFIPGDVHTTHGS